MNKIASFIIIFSFIVQIFYGQKYVEKKGGVCFRVDDNQPIEYYNMFSDLFNKYNYKFCFAINLGSSQKFDVKYCRMVRSLIDQKHEFMDHTPDHTTTYFMLDDIKDTAHYSGKPGVDHIDNKKICLKYEKNININSYTGEGLINLNDNIALSKQNGEFKNFTRAQENLFGIYVPYLKKIFVVNKINANNSADPDTLYLKSLWNDDVDLRKYTNLTYHQLKFEDIRMTYEARQRLAERTLVLSRFFKLPQPYCWVQPGGYFPRFDRNDLASVYGDLYHYTSGAVYNDSTLKCFNEPDSSGLSRFGMQWGDFSPDYNYFKKNRELISESVAKHYVEIGSSHFSELNGGWKNFLYRVDSLLQWCKQYDIPVKTYSQWSAILYDSIPNPFENIIPPFDIDRDEDNFPDGYDKKFGVFSKSDTSDEAFHYYFTNDKRGSICSIRQLAGIEKGRNLFEIYIKGATKDPVVFLYSFSGQQLKSKPFRYIVTENWTKYTSIIDVPEQAAYMNLVFFSYSGDSVIGNIKISNLSIRKLSDIDIHIKPQESEIGHIFMPIHLDSCLNNSFYKSNQIHWKFGSNGELTIRFDTINSILSIAKPYKFWIGKDTILCEANNQDGVSTTFQFVCTSDYIRICRGTSLKIDTSQFCRSCKINPDFIDTTVVKIDSSLIELSPKLTSKYELIRFDNFGNKKLIDFTIIVDSFALIPEKPTGDKEVCSNVLTSKYYTKSVTGGNGYVWKLLPEDAGSLSYDSLNCQLSWNPTFSGEVSMYVKAFNSCGFTKEPEALYINRYLMPLPAFSDDIDQSSVEFINLSTNATTYLWDFGDGTFSNEMNPTHYYKAGNYIATLTAENNGCYDSISDEILLSSTDIINAKSLFKVFPNPNSQNYLFVVADDSFYNIRYEIINTYGIIITSGIVGPYGIIDLPFLTRGVYILKLESKNYSEVKKLLIATH